MIGINLTFSATERKQIALRFKTLYEVVTAKTWTQGNMGEAVDKDGDEVEYGQSHLRKMGKKGKATIPKGLKMCLAGAAAWVNGPTEEQILALLATQIVLDYHIDYLIEIYHWMDKEGYGQEHNPAIAALVLFEQCLMAPDDGDNQLFNGDFLIVEWTNAVGIIIGFNDNHDYKQVKALIKKAQVLYAKLEKVWSVEQKYSALLKHRLAEFTELGKLF